MNSKVVNKDTITQRDSFSELLEQLANNSATVVRGEIELMIHGIREKMTAGRNGLIAMMIGAGICFVAFMSLCAALIVWLTSYMALIMASLITGAALALVGGIIALIGYRKLKKIDV